MGEEGRSFYDNQYYAHQMIQHHIQWERKGSLAFAEDRPYGNPVFVGYDHGQRVELFQTRERRLLGVCSCMDYRYDGTCWHTRQIVTSEWKRRGWS